VTRVTGESLRLRYGERAHAPLVVEGGKGFFRDSNHSVATGSSERVWSYQLPGGDATLFPSFRLLQEG
jgi:hypothetical protein